MGKLVINMLSIIYYFMRFFRSANLSRTFIDSSIIPTPSKNEYLYYGSSVPQNQSSIPICFSFFCLTPPFLLFVLSYVPPYALRTKNIHKLSTLGDMLSSLFGWRVRPAERTERRIIEKCGGNFTELKNAQKRQRPNSEETNVGLLSSSCAIRFFDIPTEKHALTQ